MALTKSILEAEIKKFSDESFILFNKFPENPQEVTSFWSSAINNYAIGVTPPSISGAAAKSQLEANWLGLSQSALGLFESGLIAYAVTLGLGMQPAFTAIPPTLPLVLSPVYVLGINGGSASDCAKLMSTIIHTWFKTGLAINNVSGVTVPWI